MLQRKNKRKIAFTALGTAVTAALLFTPLSPATAQEVPAHETVSSSETSNTELPPASEEASELADLVGMLSPVTTSEEQHLVPEIDSFDGDLILDEVPGGLSITADGDGSLTHLATGLEIGFPKQATSADAVVTDNGSIVYADDEETEIVVQSDEKTTAIHTIINDANASNEYSYPVRNGTPKIRKDGGVDIYQTVMTSGEDGELVEYTDVAATMATPWAKDANGKSVDTHYEVRGSTVVQIVEFDETTAFPVIADPSTAWGWVMCITVATVTAVSVISGGLKVIQMLKKGNKLKDAIIKAQKVWKKYKITKDMSKKKIAKVKSDRKKAMVASLGGVLAIILGADDVMGACA